LVTDAIKSTHGNKKNCQTKRNVEISTDIHVENPLEVAENECDVWGGRRNKYYSSWQSIVLSFSYWEFGGCYKGVSEVSDLRVLTLRHWVSG